MEAKNKLRYGLAVAAGVLLIVYFIDMDYENFTWKDILGPLSMALLIIAMLVSTKKSKQSEE